MGRRVVGIGVAALVAVLPACGGDGPPAGEAPEPIAEPSGEAYRFSSLAEVAATADVVVAGTVVEVRPGRQLSGLRLREAVIDVDETMKGAVEPGTTIVLEESGYASTGAGFEVAGHPWSRVGDVGVYFLDEDPSRPAGHYALFSSDGRLLEVDGEVVSSSMTPLGAEMRELAPADLLPTARSAVLDAVQQGIPAQQPWTASGDLAGPAGATGTGTDETGPTTPDDVDDAGSGS
jgi:hypothetical protein